MKSNDWSALYAKPGEQLFSCTSQSSDKLRHKTEYGKLKQTLFLTNRFLYHFPETHFSVQMLNLCNHRVYSEPSYTILQSRNRACVTASMRGYLPTSILPDFMLCDLFIFPYILPDKLGHGDQFKVHCCQITPLLLLSQHSTITWEHILHGEYTT